MLVYCSAGRTSGFPRTQWLVIAMDVDPMSRPVLCRCLNTNGDFSWGPDALLVFSLVDRDPLRAKFIHWGPKVRGEHPSRGGSASRAQCGRRNWREPVAGPVRSKIHLLVGRMSIITASGIDCDQGT